MQISEITFTTGQDGSLRIPASVLREMGLGPGDYVHIAYLSKDGQQNLYQEFLLSANPIESLCDEEQLRLPNQLLYQSNISLGADLQIICLDGLLIICQDSALNMDELAGVLKNLQAADELVGGLPVEVQQVQAELEEVIFNLQEGVDASDV